MKRPFDTIIGPEGVWKDDGAAEEECGRDEGAHEPAELNAREEFALRCLNAAANLYGVLTLEEFVSLYNGYAKDHDAPISDVMTVDELDTLVDRLLDYFMNHSEPDDFEHLLDGLCDAPEIWFSTWQLKAGEPRVIVYQDLTSSDWDEGQPPSKDADAEITRAVAGAVASFRKIDLHVLPEDDFLLYEEPMAAEETKESRAFEKFVKKEYRLDRAEQELDTLGIQCHARVNGAKVVTALEYIRDECDWEPSDYDAVVRLINALSPLLGVTRTWEGRGRTLHELFKMGLCKQFEREDIYDVFGLERQGGEAEDDDWDDDCDADGAEDGDFIRPEDIPPSTYNGPIDFAFVKDAARREAKLAVYEDVRQVTMDFVRQCVIREQTPEERRKAAVRLGFLKEGDGLGELDPTLDCVVGDFASMMDDQGDGPAIRRVLARKDELDDIDARAATYYANYRYTWLEVLAMKAGVGLKCRDLLTGEELFLMEKSLSRSAEKGMTICVGIAPMEDVYIAVGVLAPARFDNPATILKIVLTHLGLPTALPIRLDAADQARFAAETIRRIHMNGNFDSVAYRG